MSIQALCATDTHVTPGSCTIFPEEPQWVQARAAWLTPGGRLFAAFMQTDSTDGPPFACRPEAMRELFAADRWVWPDRLEPEEHPTDLLEPTGVLLRQ